MDTSQIESLQDKYAEALMRGDRDQEQKLKGEIEALFGESTPATPSPSLEDSPVVEEAAAEQPTSIAPSAEVTVKDDAPPSGETQNATATENWLESLDPKVREIVEQNLLQERQARLQAEHQFKSVNGRLAAYQRRYEETQKEAVKLKQQLTAQPQGSHATAAPKNNPIGLTKIEDDPDLAAIAKTDEELARVMFKREQALRQEMEAMRTALVEELNPLRQQFQQHSQQTELQRLTQYVPNAVEIFNHPAWEEWVNSQPRGVQQLANSDYAEDVARAIELYGQDMQRVYGAPNQQAKPAQQPVAPNPKADEVRKERERKLQAQPVGSASVRPPQRAEPTLEEIAANPELLEKFQQKIMEEELKKMGRL